VKKKVLEEVVALKMKVDDDQTGWVDDDKTGWVDEKKNLEEEVKKLNG